MSRILHLVNMGLKYLGSKGVRETRQEEPPRTSLAAAGHLQGGEGGGLGLGLERGPVLPVLLGLPRD